MKKVFSILVAFVFLTSNMGFAVGTHYCGSHPVETAIVLGKGSLGCGMEWMARMQGIESPEMAIASGHCKDEFQDLKIKDDVNSSAIQKSPEMQLILLYSFSYNYLSIGRDSKNVQPFDNNPPPLIKDLPTLFGSLLL